MLKRFTPAEDFAIRLLQRAVSAFGGQDNVILPMLKDFRDRIFGIREDAFPGLALEIFRSQYSFNPVYRSYVRALRIEPGRVQEIRQIPFLPIQFFKTHSIKTHSFEPEMIFESSGTTQTIPSRHFVEDLSLYRESFTRGFKKFYGPVEDWCIIGLLPSYLERKNSSLVMMVDDLIRLSGHERSGFYLNEYERLAIQLQDLEKQKQKTLLIGVSFALLDFADQFPMRLEHTIVMETGGMKGRRRELTRMEVHARLKEQFGIETVHAEYGMTELLSQAYSRGDGIYECVPWMRVLVRDEEDPFDIKESGTGIVNLIDLANIDSCCFIATDDMGRIQPDKRFEILGRVDNSDMRGCSLLLI